MTDRPSAGSGRPTAGPPRADRTPAAEPDPPDLDVPATDPLPVPVPGLVVLIGAAGAGKSTLAARLFAADEILSSDALRALVSGDEADQRATRAAFAILHREALRRLADGRLVVVDATNVEHAARVALVALAGRSGAPATAIVIAPPAPDVHARNAGRPGRMVPVEIVDRHLGALGRLGVTPAEIVARLRGDGFASARVLATAADLAAFAVVRVAAQPSRTRPNARARSSTQTPFRR